MSTSGFDNDFEIAIGAVFDDAASQRVIREFLNFAAKVEKEQRGSLTEQLRMAEKFYSDRIKAEAAAGRKWNDSQKRAFTALLVTTREFLRERAQTEREASQDRRRAYEREEKDRLQANRTADRLRVQQQQQTDRLLFNAEQESAAKRIARSKALYATLASVARSGAQATTNVVTSFFRRRENEAQRSGDRITNIERTTNNRTTNVIRQQLDAQNGEYTRAARRRLQTIEANAANERTVITRNAVKQAETTAALQQRASTGLLGAATGRSAAGGFLQGALYSAAGLYGIKKLIDASSDLAESQSKVKVVFGDSAAEVERFAARSAKAIGESEQATLEALGTYGNLFQSFGVGRKLAAEYSVGLVQLASDLASFNNTSVSDAIEALRSGLTGETEPLKRYGIAINETLLKQEAARLGLVKANVSQTDLTKNTIAAEKAQRAAAKAAAKYGADSIEAREAMAKYDAVVEKVGKSLKGKLPAQLDSAQKAQAAYSLIMQRSTLAQGDFNRTQAGFANQSRIVTARLKDLQAAAGNGLLPIFLGIATVLNTAVLPVLERSVDVVSGFVKRIAEGEGAYKVVRDGLIGLAGALGALLAVKAGAEVIGIVADGAKSLVGIVALHPALAVLVGLSAVGVALYRNAPGIRDFFDSLVEGTKNWYLVGYRISEPIKNLSNIVLLQSSFGAAARVIVDGFKLILAGVDDLRNGLGTGALEEALRVTLRGLGDVLTPARDVVADGLQVIFERGRDFLTQRALPILASARLNVGSFLLSIFGLGGGGGIVSRLLSTAITKVFLSSVDDFDLSGAKTRIATLATRLFDPLSNPEKLGKSITQTLQGSVAAAAAAIGPASAGGGLGEKLAESVNDSFTQATKLVDGTRAAVLGARVRSAIIRAVLVGRGVGLNVGRFLVALFNGQVDTSSVASVVGGKLNDIIGEAFDWAAGRLTGVTDLLASIGGAIASGFTSYVLPKLIELPRIVGRFISKTVFSEEFLKAVTITAAAVAGVAVVVAGQFVRGFIEGLIERRGDIAKTVIDILGFVAKTVLGSGNPLVVIGGSLVAAFAGAKVFGAISKLRGQFRIAAAGMTGDAKKVEAAIESATTAKAPRTSSKVGNTALRVADGYEKARQVVVRVGKAVEGAGVKTVRLGGLIDTVGNRLLKLPLDAQVNAAGRLYSAKARGYVKDTTKDLSSLRRAAGQFANKYADLISTPLIKAGAAVQAFPRQVQSRFQKAGGYAKDMAKVVKDTVPEGFSKAQYAALTGTTAISGYLSGLADDAVQKAAGIVATVSQIGSALATGGPILGSITAAVGVISYFWGESTRAANKAKEAQKRAAEEAAASAEEIGAAFRAAFKDQGGATSGEGRAAGVLRIIRDLLDVNSKGAKDFADRFKTDMNDVATAAGLPRKEFERFTSAVIDRNVSEVLEGNADAIKRFSNQTRIAGQAAVTSFLDSIASKEDSATFERILQSSGADIIDLQKKVQTGAISIGEFRDRMVEIGFTTQDADRAYKAYKESLTEAIGNTAGGQFLRNLPSQLYAAVRQQGLLDEANAELQSRLEGFGPVAERFSSAWGRIKTAIDKAKEAYLNWVDASTGRKLSRAEAISGLFGAAQDFTTPEEGENSLLAEARQTRARVEAQRVIAGQLQELAKQAAGDPAKLNALINDFFNELRAGTKDKETIDFFNQIQYLTADPQSIQILVDSQPAIEGLNGLETQIRTLLQLPENSPLRVGLEKARNFDEAEMLVTASLTELAKQDPRIQAYIEKNGGFDAVRDQVIADAGFIDSLKAKAEADLDADPFTKKKDLITAGLDELENRETALRIRPFLVDPTGDWTNLFGIIGLDLGIGGGGSKSGSLPTGGNWGDYGGGGSSRLNPQSNVPPTRPRPLTSGGRRGGRMVTPDGAAGGAIGNLRNPAADERLAFGRLGAAVEKSIGLSTFRGKRSGFLAGVIKLVEDAGVELTAFADLALKAFQTGIKGAYYDATAAFESSIKLYGERLRSAVWRAGDSFVSDVERIIAAAVPRVTPNGQVGGPAGGFTSLFQRWGGIDSYAIGGITQAHIQRRQRIKYAEPQTGGEAYVPRRGNKARSEAITHVIASWLGGKFVPAGATKPMAAGGVWGDTRGWQYRNGWWYDRNGKRVGYAPEEDSAVYDRPGGRRIGPRITTPAPTPQQAQRRFTESFFRYNVDPSNRLGASYSMPRFGTRVDEGRTDTHVRNNRDGSIDVLENGTNKVLEHFSAAIVKLNKIMATVSKSMTFAEAQAAVLAATAAQRERGAGAYARWLEALTRFFSGGNAMATIKGTETVAGLDKNPPRRFGGPTLPKPTRATAPSASRDDGKATVVINRNLHVENHIDGSKGSTATALEVVRKARDSDFLAGGRTIEMEFIA